MNVWEIFDPLLYEFEKRVESGENTCIFIFTWWPQIPGWKVHLAFLCQLISALEVGISLQNPRSASSCYLIIFFVILKISILNVLRIGAVGVNCHWYFSRILLWWAGPTLCRNWWRELRIQDPPQKRTRTRLGRGARRHDSGRFSEKLHAIHRRPLLSPPPPIPPMHVLMDKLKEKQPQSQGLNTRNEI